MPYVRRFYAHRILATLCVAFALNLLICAPALAGEKPAYLQGLSSGTHTVQARFDDDVSQKAHFTIAESESALPRTDDPAPTWLGWVCALALACVVISRRMVKRLG